jgi:predicted lipoprotein with Yx(FWY)xxD motif
MALRGGRTLAALLFVMVIGAALASCGAGSSTEVSCATSDALVCTKLIQLDGSNRSVLATQQGKTLYAYKPDTSTKIVCTGACAIAWPPLTASNPIPSTLDGLSGTLGEQSGGNGSQVVYNGHPLYSYSLDTSISDARGQGAEGGNWSAVTPDIAPLGAPSSGEPTATPMDPYGY